SRPTLALKDAGYVLRFASPILTCPCWFDASLNCCPVFGVHFNLIRLTPHITGSKKQSEELAAHLFCLTAWVCYVAPCECKHVTFNPLSYQHQQ
ncbi:MAG: hypothetical protein KBB83_07185, partial [Alphaproteobacteria bacterium]|nr:hypothetical protein [Alphaproteobacteria bacterium]